MKKIIFVADLFAEEFTGGGELNNHEFCIFLQKSGFEILKIKSSQVNSLFLKDNLNNFFIFGNFIDLDKKLFETIYKSARYIIYEHDHKYCINRNPATFINFLVPEEQIINKEFYKNAKYVFTQSEFHKNILEKNLKLDNIINLSGNFWKQETINFLYEKSKIEKIKKFVLLGSNVWHKNTAGSIDYCLKNNLEYEIINFNSNYENFLESFTRYDGFIFLPKTPETLSRTCVEARLSGMTVKTNQLIGAKNEPWFKESPQIIKNYLLNDFRENILNKVKEALDV